MKKAKAGRKTKKKAESKKVNENFFNIMKKIFWAIVIINLIVVSYIFLPRQFAWIIFPIAAFLSFVSFGLGIGLIITTLKSGIKGKLKFFIILLGVSSAGFMGFSVLHNLFYALTILSGDFFVLMHVMEALHVAFFTLAVIGSPIGFLAGAIGGIVCFRKEKQKIMKK